VCVERQEGSCFRKGVWLLGGRNPWTGNPVRGCWMKQAGEVEMRSKPSRGCESLRTELSGNWEVPREVDAFDDVAKRTRNPG